MCTGGSSKDVQDPGGTPDNWVGGGSLSCRLVSRQRGAGGFSETRQAEAEFLGLSFTHRQLNMKRIVHEQHEQTSVVVLDTFHGGEVRQHFCGCPKKTDRGEDSTIFVSEEPENRTCLGHRATKRMHTSEKVTYCCGGPARPRITTPGREYGARAWVVQNAGSITAEELPVPQHNDQYAACK